MSLPGPGVTPSSRICWASLMALPRPVDSWSRAFSKTAWALASDAPTSMKDCEKVVSFS